MLVVTNVQISDTETPTANLKPRGRSSNTHLIRDEDISITLVGGTDWRLTVSPSPNRFGTSTITIQVTDSQLLTTSNSFLLTVVPPFVADAPAVRLANPKTNETFLAGADVFLEADALGTIGRVTKVEFFQGATKLGETNTAPFQFTWRVPAQGTYELRAKATDDRGGTNTSDRVLIKVSSTLPPPRPEISVNEGEQVVIPVPGGNPDHETTLEYATADETAFSDRDYVPSFFGKLKWPAGYVGTTNLILQTLPDNVFDPNKTFLVRFTNPSRGLPAVYPDVRVTIVETNRPPLVFIKDADKVVRKEEGNGGVTQVSSLFFTLGISMPFDRPVPVDFVITNGTALPGKDYVWFGGFDTVSFAPGKTETTIRVKVIGDVLDEEDEETLFVQLVGADLALIDESRSLGKAIILDDDNPPIISISDAAPVLEGPAETTTNAVFTVVLSEGSSKPVFAQYVIGGVEATAGVDYRAVTNGVVRFEPGEIRTNITVIVIGDALNEPDETFFVTLTNLNPTIVRPGVLQAKATILNDDALPEISIRGTNVFEGPTGINEINIQVSLSTPHFAPVTVDFATIPGTAIAGLDYVFATNRLTFAPLDKTKTITLSILGDTLNEFDETFSVKLFNPTNATIAVVQGEALITIIDDDPLPTISIQGVAVTEGNVGTTNAIFLLKLSNPSGKEVTVGYRTAEETAQAGIDYLHATNVVAFDPGKTDKTITVVVNGDSLIEANETFLVMLSSPTNAILATTQAQGTIVDDEKKPGLSVSNVSVREGAQGLVDAIFTVSLSEPTTEIVMVDFVTRSETAIAQIDFLPRFDTLMFDRGEISKTVIIQVIGDKINELDEQFSLLLAEPINATITKGQGLATIRDDDPLPTVSISDAPPVIEGNIGSPTSAVFVVSLSQASGQAVTVHFSTSNGTAKANLDFQDITEGRLIIEPDKTNAVIAVPIIGDAINEGPEDFFLKLTGAENATVGTSEARATVQDDDPLPLVSISDATAVTEGIAGSTTNSVFVVSLSQASGQVVTVHFSTVHETATAGVDYEAATNGTVRIEPGLTSAAINVAIVADNLSETNETFFVNLTGADNATILPDTSQGKATIIDDDPMPAISISDMPILEGNSGFTRVPFAVTLSSPSGQTVTVDFVTAGGTATEDTDYVGNSGTLTFQPGQTSTNIVIVVIGDLLDEQAETFFVNLTKPNNATLAKAQGVGTLRNDDVAPAITITDYNLTEGNSGTIAAIFNVNLSEPSSQIVTVLVATADQTALAGLDYEPIAPTKLIFSPGETTQKVTVLVKGDITNEPEETFLVLLSAPDNGILLDNQAIGTITDDDAPVGISISDAQGTETDSGTANVVFSVTLTAPSEKEVTVNYSTADNSATAGNDYVKVSGTLTFPIRSVARTITVAVTGDLLNEEVERFFVNLSSPTNAIILDGQGIGTIADNDPLPEISITDTNVVEGRTASFTVRLSTPSGRKVTVQFATFNGSADAPSEYATTAGTLTFDVGETTRTIEIATVDDSFDEPDETFSVRLTSPTHAIIARGEGVGTIINNDIAPTISINDVDVTEGDTGTVNAVFTVSLNAPSAQQVSVNFATTSGTATSPEDFATKVGTLVFPLGTTSQSITIVVNGDRIDEPREVFYVDLSTPLNAVLGVKRGTGTILDDDVEPTLSITDAAAPEGNSGTNQMIFTVRLSAVSSQTVTAAFTTADGSAVAGSDYVQTAGSLTFLPGTLTNVIQVPIIADAFHETNETFEVRLTDVKNARLTDGLGLGTLIDDDVQPTLTIGDVVIAEGNSGRTNAAFVVRLSIASSETVSVGFKTSDGTTSVGADYLATSGKLTFPPGTLTQTVLVDVIGDTVFEANETFLVTLTSPVNAGLADDQGLGTILNDDPATNQPPIVRLTSPANGSAFTTPVEIPITVDARDPDGKIQRVDIFVGSILLSRITAPPFSLIWTNEAAGAYALSATAVDDQGAATTASPVTILVSRSVIASDVAIVRNFPDPEITQVQDYLLELGVSSQVFDQEGLTFEAIKDYKLIIWDDLGSAAQGLTDTDVGIFREAFDHEIAIFFIGEALSASTKNLSALQRNQWINLIHLTPDENRRGNGTVTLDQKTGHPIINGHFGIIPSFACSTNLSGIAQPTPGVTLLGKSGTADVLLAFEDEILGTPTRTLTQSFAAVNGSDTLGLAERKRLFKNGASWLLRKGFQSLTDLSIALTGPADRATVGQQLTYTGTIGHQGEIGGSGVTVTIPLPSNTKFVSASFIQGSVSEVGDALIYNLGNMESAQQAIFTFVVTPTAPGTITIRASVTGNEADPGPFNNSDSVETVVVGDPSGVPRLMVARLENQMLRLFLSVPPQRTYSLQASTNLLSWVNVTNFNASSSTFSLDPSTAAKFKEQFFRIISP